MLILKTNISVILAKAGIQFDFKWGNKMDSRLSENDGLEAFSVPLCHCGEVFKSKVSQP